jgi:hypothetical protein
MCVGADYRSSTNTCWLKSTLKAEPTRVRGIDTLTPCSDDKPGKPITRTTAVQSEKFASITNRVMNASAKQVRQGRYADSVEVRGKCYCLSNFDHGIGNMAAPSGGGNIRQACARIGPPPSNLRKEWRYYNDIGCGHGPPNTSIDERECPGLVGAGPSGCQHKGPRWW